MASVTPDYITTQLAEEFPISHCISMISIRLHACPIFPEIKNLIKPELNWNSASKKEGKGNDVKSPTKMVSPDE